VTVFHNPRKEVKLFDSLALESLKKIGVYISYFDISSSGKNAVFKNKNEMFSRKN
jgi:hypothetical protein